MSILKKEVELLNNRILQEKERYTQFDRVEKIYKRAVERGLLNKPKYDLLNPLEMERVFHKK